MILGGATISIKDHSDPEVLATHGHQKPELALSDVLPPLTESPGVLLNPVEEDTRVFLSCLESKGPDEVLHVFIVLFTEHNIFQHKLALERGDLALDPPRLHHWREGTWLWIPPGSTTGERGPGSGSPQAPPLERGNLALDPQAPPLERVDLALYPPGSIGSRSQALQRVDLGSPAEGSTRSLISRAIKPLYP
ncbi:unnamed protein product [Gadus morhua 'NCC']